MVVQKVSLFAGSTHSNIWGETAGIADGCDLLWSGSWERICVHFTHVHIHPNRGIEQWGKIHTELMSLHQEYVGNFWFKMAEQKDVCSSPARAPKLQRAVEQPLTEGCWNPPKRDTRRDSRAERGSLLPLEMNACLPGCIWNATPRSLSPVERNICFWTQA